MIWSWKTIKWVSGDRSKMAGYILQRYSNNGATGNVLYCYLAGDYMYAFICIIHQTNKWVHQGYRMQDQYTKIKCISIH